MVKQVVVKYRDKRPSDQQQAWWSEKQKYDAVASYLLFGNLALVGRMTGIPERTLRKWKASPWWNEAENEVRKSSKVQLSGKLVKSIELANMQLEDRLQNGDFLYDQKTGQMVRKPVSADTAVKVLDKLIERQEMLDKSARALDTTTQEGVTERLAKLAEDFMKFANTKTIEGQVTHEISEAIDAEVVREEGTSGTDEDSAVDAVATSDAERGSGGDSSGVPSDPAPTDDPDEAGGDASRVASGDV
jgi:hypothetical protein